MSKDSKRKNSQAILAKLAGGKSSDQSPFTEKLIILLSEDSRLCDNLNKNLKDSEKALVGITSTIDALNKIKNSPVDVCVIDTHLKEGKIEDFMSLARSISPNKDLSFILLSDTVDLEHTVKVGSDLKVVGCKRKQLSRELLGKSLRKLVDPNYDPDKEEIDAGRVLLVDADSEHRRHLSECLKRQNHEVFESENAQGGLTRAREKLPDVIIANINQPDKSGVELIKDFKADPALNGIPILILCDQANLVFSRTTAFANGALGCITVPIDEHEVSAQVGVMVKLTQTLAQMQEHAVSLAVSNFELQETKLLLEQKSNELKVSSEYKSEFLAKMSHELRTPLTAMMGFAQKLLHASSQDPDYKDSIRTILRNGDHLLDLINDILDLSKIEAGKLDLDVHSCSPAEILQDVKALMNIRAEQKGLSFWIEYQSDLPDKIMTDPMRVKQILLNLVGNSIKFTNKGTVKVAVSCSKIDQTILFQVIDTGIGIPEDKKNQLFQAFVQGDVNITRRFGGTGLGLTISLQLAELLGGTVSVDSILGMGSSFKVTIKTGDISKERFLTPLELENLKFEDSAREEIQIATLEGRILLAEDNLDNQKLLRFYLDKSNARYEIVANGQEALEKALNENFDLVLLDMQMPIMDGYVAAKKLRERGFVKPIIGLTANNLESELKKAIDAGCDKVLSKPYDWNTLFLVLKSYIGSKNGPGVVKIKSTANQPAPITTTEIKGQVPAEKVSTGPASPDSPILSDMFADNPDLQPIIIEFLEGLDQYVDRVRAAVRDDKWSDLRAVAHDISGVSGMYGFIECSEAAKQMRLACINQDVSQINKKAEELISVISRMKLGLKTLKNPESSPPIMMASANETEVITSELFNVSPDLAPSIKEFLSNLEMITEKLREATSTMDWTRAATISNEISGTAALYGFPTFANIAKEIEMAAQQGQVIRIPELVQSLSRVKDAMLRGKS